MGDVGKLVACLKELGFKPKVDSFQHRLVIQKVMYLLERKGVKTGFTFGLYVRGPYSPDLTEAFYSHRKEVEGLKGGSELNAKEKADVCELNALFSLNASWLEVAATYAFFAYAQGLDPFTATIKVRELKPFFSEAQIAVGTSKAKEFLFKPTEKDLKEMKDEFSVWESASAVN